MFRTEITKIESLLLSLLNIKSTNKINSILNELENNEFGLEFLNRIIQLGLGQILYKCINDSKLNNLIIFNELNLLQKYYFYNLQRNLKIQQIFHEIINIANNEGIEVVALKGIALIENFYSDIAIRQLSDIDILVHVEDKEKLKAALEMNGFNSNAESGDFLFDNREVIHLPPLKKAGIAVEIHFKLYYNFDNYNINHEELFGRKKSIIKNGHSYFILDKIDHIIFIILHLDKHFKNGGLQFSGYIDIVNLLGQLNDTSWSLFVSRCTTIGCINQVFCHIIISVEYMSLEIPDSIYSEFRNCLDNRNRMMFIEYFHGKKKNSNGIQQHIGSLNRLSLKNKIYYFFKAIFPTKKYIVVKYLLNKNPDFFKKAVGYEEFLKQSDNKYPKYLYMIWWIFYPYRWYVGLRGIILYLLKK